MKRLKMSQDAYNELLESRDWCKLHGHTGMAQWYDEELAFQAKRRALPHSVQAAHDDEAQQDERPRRR